MEPTIYSAEAQALAAILRDLRAKAGLTQAQLAALLEEPQQFVSSIERGQRRLDLLEARAYTTALGTTVVDLLRLLDAAVS